MGHELLVIIKIKLVAQAGIFINKMNRRPKWISHSKVRMRDYCSVKLWFAVCMCVHVCACACAHVCVLGCNV